MGRVAAKYAFVDSPCVVSMPTLKGEKDKEREKDKK